MSFHKDDQPMPGSTGVHMHARVSPDQQRSTSATGEQMDNLLLPIDDSIYSYYAFQSAKNCIQKANGRARLFFFARRQTFWNSNGETHSTKED
jgi:hypothetical protein